MSTHNICLYDKVDKKYTGCNMKTMELLDCALIGVCAVIRSNMVYYGVNTVLVELNIMVHVRSDKVIRPWNIGQGHKINYIESMLERQKVFARLDYC